MDIKKHILRAVVKRGRIKVLDITKETGLSRAYVSRLFHELRMDGKIVLLGKANRARYILASASNARLAKQSSMSFSRYLNNSKLSEDLVLGEIKKETGIFMNLPTNISRILDYAFTEILNNAIEHSRSKTIFVKMSRDQEIKFSIDDNGVGIFQNIIKKKKLKNDLEAIQELLKGKQTTAPEAHTGEGIFFTSKIADMFTIKGSGKKLIFNNNIDDIFINNIKKIRGTKVEFKIAPKSKRDLSAVFKEYSNDAFEFSKTKVVVDLYRLGSEFISRSQARRIMTGLDKFQTIILDFKNVGTVGQAFADEVFRVWKSNHSGIEIINKNANENIEFMIKRAL